MGKLALKIYKALYGLDIEAQNTELTRLRLENKRLSELLRSTSREYNSLNEKYKKNKESINTQSAKYPKRNKNPFAHKNSK